MSAPRNKKIITKEPPPPAWRGDLDKLMESSASLVKAATNYSEKARNKDSPICHGRVSNLQEMVPEQWWKTLFSDAMYLKTDGDVVEDPAITREELEELIRIPEIKSIFMKGSEVGVDERSVVEPGRILDLCCGQGRHSLHLIKEFPHLLVHGHDQSSYLISLAQERAAFQNVTAQTFFTVGDCRQIPYPKEHFDLVLLMGNSFGYFSNDDQDKAVLKEIMRVLRPGGRLVLDLTDGDYMRDNFAEKSWEWVDDTTFVCRERELSKDSTRLNSREIITITNKGVVRDQFYQERLYSRNDLHTLLEEVGLQVVIPKSTKTFTMTQKLSKRNEDLGMMEQRMVITASKPDVDTTPVVLPKLPSKIAKRVPHITLLLGDPSQPCIGKWNNTWNEEDLETRRKLLEALDKGGYSYDSITVLDSHSDVIEQLTRNKPEFVFNLCDEGWNNEALKELHVPALLELLHIPYSGAGPNCLAFCYDKGLVNRSAEAIGIPTPIELTYLGKIQPLSCIIEQVSKMGYPVFIKPIKGDNSLGITQRSIARNSTELVSYIEELRDMDLHDILIQEYLQGKEYGVGMIGNSETGFKFLPIIQVNYSKIVDRNLPPILGFESKWDPKSPYWTDITYEKADLPNETVQQLQKTCIELWKRFECRDYARFDFRSNSEGVIKLLEVNPNPGWCWDGKFAYMAKLEDIEYSGLLDLILKAAWKRLNI